MRLTIGALAKLAGCQAVTIRYYEKEGLLPRPPRSEGNYRIYGEKEADRLRFIRHCRLHGMSLGDIRALLAFRDHPTASCDWINALVARHIANVEAQITELTHLRDHLRELLRSCSGDKGGDCGILARLDRCAECPVCRRQGGRAANGDRGRREP